MKALAVGLLSLALVGCASPTVTASPTPAGTLTGTPAPTPTVVLSPLANVPPSPNASLAVACGSLAADSCANAVAAAVSVLPATHPPVLAVRIEVPTALMTCPPGGGVAGHQCSLIVSVTTSAGDTTIPLVRTAGGWIPAYLVK